MATCGHCGYESHAVALCPLCGHRMSGFGAAGPGAAGPAASGAPPVPWEDPSAGLPRNLFATWSRSLLEPGRFYRGVPFEAPALRPLLYFLIVTLVSALFTLWWRAVGVLPAELVVPFGGRGSSSAWAAVEFFLTPFSALAMLLISAAVLHLMALLLAPGRRGFTATLRVLCYAAGPGVLTALPWLGGLVGGVWSLVLTVVGVREAHRTTTGRAAAIVLLPVAALVLVGLGFVLLAVLAAGTPWLQ